MLGVTVALRTGLFFQRGEIQQLAYWTIVGRIDQFMLGIAAFQLSLWFKGRHWVAAGLAIGFSFFYWWFDLRGGLCGIQSEPLAKCAELTKPSFLWVVIPTLEGIAYASLIAYYDRTYSPKPTGFSWLLGKAGAYSYSIYLFHFFFVFRAADFINKKVIPLSNWYIAEAFAILCFVLMIPLGYLSFRFIEAPFLKLRAPYAHPREASEERRRAASSAE